ELEHAVLDRVEVPLSVLETTLADRARGREASEMPEFRVRPRPVVEYVGRPPDHREGLAHKTAFVTLDVFHVLLGEPAACPGLDDSLSPRGHVRTSYWYSRHAAEGRLARAEFLPPPRPSARR